MGRFLREKTVLDLAKQTRITFTLKDLGKSTFTAGERGIANRLEHGKPILFKEIDDTTLRGYGLIRDIQGKPALLVLADFSRDVLQRGKTTARMVSFAMLAAFFIICIFLVVWFVSFQAESHRRQKRIEKLVDKRTRELQESEERLRTLINATPDAICFKDGAGRWLEANQAQLELFQLKRPAYQGKKDSELAEETHAVFRDALLCCEETDNQAWTSGSLSRSQECIRLPSGAIKVLDVLKVPLFSADGGRKGIIVFSRDVTNEKILQDKLQKAEKMEAIGLMAGGVAHDLNNILAGLVGYPDLLLMNLPAESEMRPPLEAIKASGRRAAEVVSDLLTIARGAAAVKKIANLNVIIEEYLESPECKKMKASFPDISCETRFDSGLFNVFCSPIHIKKCVMNLLNNAAEAISGNGHIVISTRNQYIDTPLPGNQYMERGEYAVITVSDTGPGIPEKDIDRIFEPFYTKKVMGKSGTGLGLTVVWNTIQDHGGGVKVVSSEREGTDFELYFPSTRKELSEQMEDAGIEELQGNGQKILVVDDEAQQQDIASQILTSLGYHVECLDSGEKAIEYLQENEVDLLVLDMIMVPGMNGRQAYEQIIKFQPGQKAIIVSGFSEDEEVKEAQRFGAGRFVKKPYTSVQIGSAVKMALRE
jgi:PAS domain S-box-containing protein